MLSSAMIAACCVKSAQTVNRMRALVGEGITEKDWTEALIKKTFEEPIPDKPEDTPLTKGEFDIVKALLVKCPEVMVGKILVDKMVDLAGPGADGAGGTHLRWISFFDKVSLLVSIETFKCVGLSQKSLLLSEIFLLNL